MIGSRSDHFRFGQFLLKKITKLKKKNLKKNQNRFKPTGFGSVRFDFLDKN